MDPGWHMLLDDYLDYCHHSFQNCDLDGAAADLEATLQQQIKSQVWVSDWLPFFHAENDAVWV